MVFQWEITLDESHHMQTSEGFRYIVGAVSALSGLLSANGGAKVRRGGAIYPQYSFERTSLRLIMELLYQSEL